MAQLEYHATEAKVRDDNGNEVKFYGIRAIDSSFGVVFELPDISREEERVRQLVELLEKNKVEVCHIEAVIEDLFWS